MIRAIAAAAAVALLAAVVAGCAGDDDDDASTRQESVATVATTAGDPPSPATARKVQAGVSALYRALDARRPHDLCEILAPSARRRLVRAEGRSCAAYFASTLRGRRREGRVTVLEVKVAGDRATAGLLLGDGTSGQAALARTARGWMVTSFTLPP